MTLSDLSIKRPVFTTMMACLVVVLGLLGLSRLGTDLYPDVSFPFVAVSVVYRGAGPSEVESQVVKPIEDSLAGISGVENMQSFSREGFGLVFVQFKLSVPLDRAVQEVRDKVAQVSDLPREAEVPRVSRIDLGAQPILTYVVKADLPTTELRQVIKEKLEPALAQLDGVAQVKVVERIGMENVDVPAGRFELGPTELQVRSLGQLRTVEDLARLPVVKDPTTGTQVLLSQVAEVSDAVADRRTIARLNGEEAVVVEIVKQPGSNTVEVARAVKDRLARLGPSLAPGFDASLIIDSSVDIEENAHEVWVALLFGGVMAVLIILVFLLDVRGTFISSLALPTSVIGTFFVMYALDYSLNQMTLIALSLAIGLLIDDAVVVREAITHRLERGENPMDAASKGTRDVFLAVLATTLSLVAVFVPVAFMPGVVGQFFKQFGLTISAAVLISMFISFTLDPMLSARLSRQVDPAHRPRENRVVRWLRGAFEATEARYGQALGWTLRHRWLTAGVTLAVVAGSVVVAGQLGNDFMVPQDKSTLIVTLKLPEGTSLAETTARAAQAEAIVRELPDVVDIFTVVGADPSNFGGGDANHARLRILTRPRGARELTLDAMKERLRARLATLPPMEVALIDPPDLEGLGDFFPMMIYVMGPEFGGLEAEAARLRAMMEGFRTADGQPVITDIRVASSPPRPELAVVIDRDRAADAQLSSAALGTQLRLAMNGQVAGKLREGARETDILVRLREADRTSPERLAGMEVFTPAGTRAVGDVATVTTQALPAVIEHFDRERRVMIIASNAPGVSLGEASARLKQALATAPPPPGYTLAFDGNMKLLDEQNDSFGLVFLLAFAFVYMVLASQFESFKHPLTIMVSVPLALIGAALALYVTGWSLSLGAMIGLILLMGLVTKNAILLVDQALQNLREGDDLDTAILRAGPRRLRPILMTSAAMAIGMVPTALGRGQGFEFRAPMAIGVIGGVITSTILTLFVVPLVFAALEKLTPRAFRAGAAPPHPVSPAEVSS